MPNQSLAETIALLPEKERDRVLAGVDADKLKYDWKFWGRPSQLQLIEEEFDLGVLLGGRGSGKELALDTPVPTPSGWTTMGELSVGDQVFDELGVPCRVLEIFDDPAPKTCYEITFSDGTAIRAGADHQWVTWTHRDRKQFLRHNESPVDFPTDWVNFVQPAGLNRWGTEIAAASPSGPQIRTTQEVVDTFYQPTARGDLNHCIPLARSLQLQEAVLPIDPWLFGYWLGDGASAGACLHVGSEDLAWVNERVRALGEPGWTHEDKTAWRIYLTDRILREPYDLSRAGTFAARLRNLGVIKNKHVPMLYLRASASQRAQLLSGLLDSDGYAGKGGQVEFTSTREQLALDVLELARSLSYMPTLSKGVATLYGVEIGPKYRVTWRAHTNPFSMPRKRERWHPPAAQGLRTRHRMLRDFVQISSEPMRCITVDSPNSMYLVSEAMIPTHNTRAGCEFARDKAKKEPGSRGALVARTAADVRDVIVKGDSGLLAISPPSEMPIYEPSKRLLTWPNGSSALCFSSEEPDQLRGPNFHWALADETASWKYQPDDSGLTAWDNLRIATRLGVRPQVVAMTTPKRTEFMRKLTEEEGKPGVILIRGSTRDNAANLSKTYLDVIYGLYAGTRLAQQELEGLLLDDVEGALLSIDQIRAARVGALPPNARLTVIGVDPSVADRPKDECGIIVATSTMESELYKRHAYVLEDATVHGSPEVWARRVTEVARRWGAPVIAEVNQGAALVRMTLQTVDPTVRVIEVRARYGKAVRAEPVVSAYSQGRVHHVGEFPEYEDQFTSWVPGETSKSPDRVDAAVWALTALLVKQPKDLYVAPIRARSSARKRVDVSRSGNFWNRSGRSRVGY